MFRFTSHRLQNRQIFLCFVRFHLNAFLLVFSSLTFLSAFLTPLYTRYLMFKHCGYTNAYCSDHGQAISNEITEKNQTETIPRNLF